MNIQFKIIVIRKLPFRGTIKTSEHWSVAFVLLYIKRTQSKSFLDFFHLVQFHLRELLYFYKCQFITNEI